MSSGSGGNRSLKRSASAAFLDIPDQENIRSAIDALLERLSTVLHNAESARSEHLSTIKKIDETIAVKQTATRAAARVGAPPANHELNIFSRGVSANSRPVKAPRIEKPSLSAMNMVMESDPPEKVIHEQSIIARAQAINRRNAELARERLPKQPEAQRNKTHWDYLLDEALWLSTDFREERKWKIVMAKRLARACAAYHQQKLRRKERAVKDENDRIRRTANSLARDVRKFWGQIREIAELRVKQAEAVRLKEQRNIQLREVLQEAGHLANALSASYMENTRPTESDLKQDSDVRNGIKSNDTEKANGKQEHAQLNGNQGNTLLEATSSGSESYCTDLSDAQDDEATIEAAEDVSDPMESRKLEAEASLPVEELLRSRGIDPSSYESQRGSITTSPNGLHNNINGVHSNVRSLNGTGKLVMESVEPGEPNREHAPNGTNGLTEGNTDDKPKVAEANKTVQKGIDAQLPDSAKQVTAPTRLLKGTLRDYQLAGMQWLAALYKKNVNGILADEMGLGKTIQTISLLAWLALEKGIWGPHLIVVPTSVMVNWEVEFKKWLPAFKILTYFGSQRERKLKRVGWTRPNNFHVCITSYTLVVQDAAALRRKEWVYLILDEAHNIKNFQSQRWQVLLRFPSARRLLLTGTPLQNSVMELWSLLHFLMPSMFESQAEFKDWFYKPLSSMVAEDAIEDSKQMVSKLHEILRPFLLRRLKKDVEKSLRPKVEHVQKCQLSKRQRQLYEDFLSRSETQHTLERGDFFGVMGVLMQLRKVCNHPDLFEGRPILSPFSMKPVFYPVPALVMNLRRQQIFDRVDLSLLSLDLATEEARGWPGKWHGRQLQRLSSACVDAFSKEAAGSINSHEDADFSDAAVKASWNVQQFRKSVLRYHALLTSAKSRRRALLGEDKIFAATMEPNALLSRSRRNWESFSCARKFVHSVESRASQGVPLFERFVCCIRKVNAPLVEIRFAGDDNYRSTLTRHSAELGRKSSSLQSLFRVAHVRSSVTLPDTRLIQWDCGKLQALDLLLRQLRARGSRVLIYSQMSKVLNVLESFLNLHAIRYLRLDGSTRTDERQKICERFNTDSRIFVMILTTRAGGVGLNLTGADTVIFYDTDYNPAIDAQAQDRVHRIGQKKTVHIYRLVCEKTVEENILKRANEKRTLESIVISQAGFNIDSIRRRAGIEDLVRSTTAAPPSPAQFVEGLKRSTALNTGRAKSAVTQQLSANGQRRFSGQNGAQTKNIPILSSHGPLLSAANNTDKVMSETNRVADQNNDPKPLNVLAEGSDAYNSLLMQEENSTAKDVPPDVSNEFEDLSENESPQQSKLSNETATARNLEHSLTPIQRFALNYVESGVEDTQLEEEADKETKANGGDGDESRDSDEELEGNIAAHQPEDTSRDEGENNSEGSDEEATRLFYEQTPGAHAHLSCLKALTDTDANIKLYLPLRDGGPEELNVSTVVNGTAAAGLECAEDAAFFPHAYNRMSRTVHATLRQKEKAAYNQRRREEAERKKQREARLRALAEKNLIQSQGAETSTKSVGGRIKEDTGNSGPPSKRTRTDSGTASNTGGVDGMFPGTNGLFKKNVKRNQRKVSSRYTKSSLSLGSGSVQMGEGLGKNDGWTREEEQKLIELMALYNNNLAIVSDVLGAQPDVVSGNRRKRSLKQCCDRWFNAILKEHKNSTPAPVATLTDADVFKKNLPVFVKSAVKSTKSSYDPKTAQNTEMHKSHMRVTTEARKNPINNLNSAKPPGFPDFANKVGVRPSNAKPVASPTAQKKNPFLRNVKDYQLVPLQESTRQAWNSRVLRTFPYSTAGRPTPRLQSVPGSVSQPRPPGNKVVSFQEASRASNAAKSAAAQNARAQPKLGSSQAAQKIGTSPSASQASLQQYGQARAGVVQNGLRRAVAQPSKVAANASSVQRRVKAIPHALNRVPKAPAAMAPTTRLQPRGPVLPNSARPAAASNATTSIPAHPVATTNKMVAPANQVGTADRTKVGTGGPVPSVVGGVNTVKNSGVVAFKSTMGAPSVGNVGNATGGSSNLAQAKGNSSIRAPTNGVPVNRATPQQLVSRSVPHGNVVQQVSQPKPVLLEKKASQ